MHCILAHSRWLNQVERTCFTDKPFARGALTNVRQTARHIDCCIKRHCAHSTVRVSGYRRFDP